MNDFSELERRLGVHFKNKQLLQEALTHRSYINENRLWSVGHNERLEFLGDAVLELVVTEYLYRNYPNSEGELTNWRASLVNCKMLTTVAKELGIEKFLFLSRGENQSADSKARNYILGNAVEAIIGAVYLDQGSAAAKRLVTDTILVELPTILQEELFRDPKSTLQERAQAERNITPSYEVLEESGPDHDKRFTVGVHFGSECIAQGTGSSKQEAQVNAATAALNTLSLPPEKSSEESAEKDGYDRDDPRYHFRQLAEEKVGVIPTYQVMKEQGPEHARHITVGVYFGDRRIAKGIGPSVPQAEIKAAEAALIIKGWNGSQLSGAMT